MSNDALRFAVPNGSLWERAVKHLETAGYPLRSPDRTGHCGDRNGVEFYQVDRRMLPLFLKSGAFHAGLTGHDLWLNSGVDNLRSIEKFSFSRTSDQPSRWVLASTRDTLLAKQEFVIACELPHLAEMLLRDLKLPCTYSVLRIDGSEEQCVKHGLADAVLVVTETGNSIRANGLGIIEGCESLLISMPEIRAQHSLMDAQEEALQGLSLALKAVVGAQAFVMVTFDIPKSVNLVALKLPTSVAPTISPLINPEWQAGTVCTPRSAFGSTALTLRNAGAKSIVMQDVQAYLA